MISWTTETLFLACIEILWKITWNTPKTSLVFVLRTFANLSQWTVYFIIWTLHALADILVPVLGRWTFVTLKSIKPGFFWRTTYTFLIVQAINLTIRTAKALQFINIEIFGFVALNASSTSEEGVFRALTDWFLFVVISSIGTFLAGLQIYMPICVLFTRKALVVFKLGPRHWTTSALLLRQIVNLFIWTTFAFSLIIIKILRVETVYTRTPCEKFTSWTLAFLCICIVVLPIITSNTILSSCIPVGWKSARDTLFPIKFRFF